MPVKFLYAAATSCARGSSRGCNPALILSFISFELAKVSFVRKRPGVTEKNKQNEHVRDEKKRRELVCPGWGRKLRIRRLVLFTRTKQRSIALDCFIVTDGLITANEYD